MKTTGLLLLSFFFAAMHAAHADRPNIVLIMADDQYSLIPANGVDVGKMQVKTCFCSAF